MDVILGVKINVDDPLFKSLINIYGIGKKQSFVICKIFGLSKSTPYSSVSFKKRKKLKKILSKMLLSTSLLQKKINCIQFLQDIGSYKGFRHKKKLPVRGQRTRSNAKTKRKVFL